jgi:carbamoyltransferase
MEILENVKNLDVANLIQKNKVGAIFQGRSEAGPRALGNRSFIFNPTILDNKNYINKIKGRELFRPMACSILKEKSSEWFDMLGMDESPFMSYSFKSLEKNRDKIPAVIHVDNTCRIQTVTEEQNKNYYDIINEFYKLTNIPIIGNTSFNLAGEPIVETIEDSLHTFHNSQMDYIFFPECNILVLKK